MILAEGRTSWANSAKLSIPFWSESPREKTAAISPLENPCPAPLLSSNCPSHYAMWAAYPSQEARFFCLVAFQLVRTRDHPTRDECLCVWKILTTFWSRSSTSLPGIVSPTLCNLSIQQRTVILGKNSFSFKARPAYTSWTLQIQRNAHLLLSLRFDLPHVINQYR